VIKQVDPERQAKLKKGEPKPSAILIAIGLITVLGPRL
jgi:hypothetical protein